MPNTQSKVSGFRKEFELEVDRLMTKRVKNMHVSSVKAAYDYIMRTWPKKTYFSGANNRISITGRPIGRVEPRKRPTMPGALAGKFASTLRTEKEKLNRIKAERKSRVIIIGNAVDYAPNVSFEPGKGVRIYEEARALAEARLKRDVK